MRAEGYEKGYNECDKWKKNHACYLLPRKRITKSLVFLYNFPHHHEAVLWKIMNAVTFCAHQIYILSSSIVEHCI